MSEFFNSELWMAIMAMAPSIGGVLAAVVTALLSIKKVATVIAEFRSSNEMKQLISELKTQSTENRQLKKMNEKLLAELTRIQPMGHVDDKGD